MPDIDDIPFLSKDFKPLPRTQAPTKATTELPDFDLGHDKGYGTGWDESKLSPGEGGQCPVDEWVCLEGCEVLTGDFN